MNSDRFKRLWPEDWRVCNECGQPDNGAPCNHVRLTVEEVIRLGGQFSTRYDVMQEFQWKSDNVRRAQEEDLLDWDEVPRMIDRFRDECEEKLAGIPIQTGVTS